MYSISLKRITFVTLILFCSITSLTHATSVGYQTGFLQVPSTTSNNKASKPLPQAKPKREQVGIASWYGPNFHGKKTANGSIYNQHEYTAAHPLLPMPSIVKVINLENQRSVFVVVNDRGPYLDKSYNRIIDLSHKAAADLDMIGKGTAGVKVEYMHNQTQKVLNKISRSKVGAGGSKAQISTAMVKHTAMLNKALAG